MMFTLCVEAWAWALCETREMLFRACLARRVRSRSAQRSGSRASAWHAGACCCWPGTSGAHSRVAGAGSWPADGSALGASNSLFQVYDAFASAAGAGMFHLKNSLEGVISSPQCDGGGPLLDGFPSMERRF